jgi:dTDP-4-amino-4,6-dideoxygalactose transaminase
MQSPEVKAQKKIPLGRPVFDEREIEANRKIFDSPWVINGPEVRRFEEAFKTWIQAPHASAVSSCTAGMHLALSALKIKAGDEVLLPAFNFIAGGLSVLQAGAKPVFAEVNPQTGNLDINDLEKRITPRTRAVLALHYAGYPCALRPLTELAKNKGIKVIEDAAHALGARYENKNIGCHGDATVFSFGPLKMICTGMGGVVTSPDKDLIASVNSLRTYGMDKSMWDRREADMPWSYGVTELGHNFRMTDFQAALGIIQMEKLSGFTAIRKRLAARYDETLKKLPFVELFKPEPGADPVPLYYAVKIKNGARDKLALYLISKGIGASVHWDPALHEHILFRQFGFKRGDFPKTEALARETISLPLFPAMTDEDVDLILGHIDDFAREQKLV